MSEKPSKLKHIAIIMDGNGRWAESKGLPRTAGHKKGAESVEEAIDAGIEMGVDYITLYAFSVENWKRPETEVSALMGLLSIFLKRKLSSLTKKNVRLRAIGRIEQLPIQIRKLLVETVEKTKHNTGITMTLALSYGGREELVDAMKKIALKVADGKINPDEIDNETVKSHLYAPDIPDPDLLIRTSGEIRLSNFMLWQLSYTEMVLTKKYWPEFNKQDLFDAVEVYEKRHRRFGEVKA